MTLILKYFQKPAKLEYLHKWLKEPAVKVLDVGCGNHSASRTKKYYPSCKYYGLDKAVNYNNNEKDLSCMEQFFQIDLADINGLNRLPNNFFNCIILAHVIEHLANGEEVILELLKKLKEKGVIYIEYPSPHSVRLPSMKGTLNFHDDPTHIRLYQREVLEDLLKKNSFQVVRSGIRRSLKRILLLPAYAVVSLIYHGYLGGSVFWDITGFASYIIAIKESG